MLLKTPGKITSSLQGSVSSPVDCKSPATSSLFLPVKEAVLTLPPGPEQRAIRVSSASPRG